jgi:regulator of sigma E protease
VEPGDRLLGVELVDGDQRVLRVVSEASAKGLPDNVTEKILDPVRLSFDLRHWVGDRTGVTATIFVARDDPEQHLDGARHILKSVPWDEGRRFDREPPGAPSAPLSIPELGVAYYVDTLVDHVEPGSPAAAKLETGEQKLRTGDLVLAVSLKDVNYENGEKFRPESELFQKKDEHEPWWAHVAFSFEDPDVKAIQMKVRRGKQGGGTQDLDVEMDLASDPSWPLADRGLLLMPDRRLNKADGAWQAVTLGLRETKEFVVKTYMSLRSMITNRVSATKNLRGPITIALTAFAIAGESLPDFMFFLALISVNLAVINFLPIPVLDGGHMVFLTYEKLRGRPATEQVRLALTYVGVLLILSLMVFVLFLDVKGIWFHG